jgi:hypothetical protein
MTKILHKFVNAKAGVASEVGFYAGNAKLPYSVILRDVDADAAVAGAIRFPDEAAAVKFAKSIITDGPVPAGTFINI